MIRELEQLKEEVQKLREENETLRGEKARHQKKAETLQEVLDRLRGSLAVLGTDAKTAPAVGVPSSRTFFKQPRLAPEEQKKSGGQPGHKGTTRPRPTSNAPPRELRLERCPKCDTRLGNPCDGWSKPITDLPAGVLEIFDLIIHRYRCPGCGERVRAPIPEAYRGEFGPRLKAFVTQSRALGVPLEKIQEVLNAVYHLSVSEATLLGMERGVAESLDGTYHELWEELRDATRTPHAEGDETTFPVNGKTEPVWVGVSPTTTVYLTQHGEEVEKGARSAEAAVRFWGAYEGTLTRDGLASYNAVKSATQQACLVHLNRELQKVEAHHGIEVRGLLSERPPKFTRAGRPPREFLQFAAGMRGRFRKEVRWVERHPEASRLVRGRRYAKALRSMDRFLARRWRDRDVVRIRDTMREWRDRLFTFVRLPGVPWNSNGAEREVKVPVGIRKTQEGRKTREGTRGMDRILTVWRTCRRRGLRFFDVAVERLMWTGGAPGPPLPGPTG
ncbi:MAG: IS66 family transposase [Acidimicrobiales bacterium]